MAYRPTPRRLCVCVWVFFDVCTHTHTAKMRRKNRAVPRVMDTDWVEWEDIWIYSRSRGEIGRRWCHGVHGCAWAYWAMTTIYPYNKGAPIIALLDEEGEGLGVNNKKKTPASSICLLYLPVSLRICRSRIANIERKKQAADFFSLSRALPYTAKIVGGRSCPQRGWRKKSHPK